MRGRELRWERAVWKYHGKRTMWEQKAKDGVSWEEERTQFIEWRKKNR